MNPTPEAEKISRSVMDHLAEHGRYPVSVRKFCRDHGLADADFFREYSSFEQAESAYWGDLIRRITHAVDAATTDPDVTAKSRFLAWHYAFIEAAQADRSLMLQRFGKLSLLRTPDYLRGWNAEFDKFVGRIVERGLETGEIADRGPLVSAIQPALRLHLRAVIAFFLKDASEACEDTDAMIEKSVSFAFDLFAKQAVDSGADFAKFLFGRYWKCS